MLDHHPQGWQIDDWPTLESLGQDVLQIELAAGAGLDRMGDDLIRNLCQAHTVTWLTAWFFPAWLAQTPGLSPTTIPGRRLVTVVAIFRPSLLQGLDLLRPLFRLFRPLTNSVVPQAVCFEQQADVLLLPGYDLLLLADLLLPQFFRFSKLDQFFLRCHAFTLPDRLALRKLPGNLSSYLFS